MVNIQTLSAKAYAKLNLSLNILPQRGEMGYYRVLFINTQISLHDRVSLQRLTNRGIRINEPTIDGQDNLAAEAARLMFESFLLPGGISISIFKHIPPRAGLGGGSANAAAVINGLIELYGLGVKNDERLNLAKKIGMDVCYCSIGGLCTVEGIGDAVHKLPYQLPVLKLLIATPALKKPSTAWAYSILDDKKIGKNIDKHETLLEGIRQNNIKKIAQNLHNDFELPVQQHYPLTSRVKERMLECGALNAMLAGSGLSVFGIFENNEDIAKARSEIECGAVRCFVAQSISGGKR
jgi:4-diphosphocytidyl-2-C-methyl-D-erythritol kinase